MRMLARLELTGGWNPTAKHIPGVRNTLADGISRWPRLVVADKVKELTNSNEWSEQDIGSRGVGIFDLVLQTKNILTRHDDILWNLMMSSAEPERITRLFMHVSRSTCSLHTACAPLQHSAYIRHVRRSAYSTRSGRLSFNIRHAYGTPTNFAGTGDNKGGKKDEVARSVETLALGSVGQSTQKNYLAKWNTWVAERKAQSKGPWLYALDDPDSTLNDLLEFMASRCFVLNNQQSTVRGYLAAIIFFHKMFAGWELPTSHCAILAVGRGTDRAHGISNKKAG